MAKCGITAPEFYWSLITMTNSESLFSAPQVRYYSIEQIL